jgi:hypothetical protein
VINDNANRKEKIMTKVYVYTRNSNAEAFEKGSSRETQIKKCTNYASIKDLTIDEGS